MTGREYPLRDGRLSLGPLVVGSNDEVRGSYLVHVRCGALENQVPARGLPVHEDAFRTIVACFFQ